MEARWGIWKTVVFATVVTVTAVAKAAVFYALGNNSVVKRGFLLYDGGD
jgi:hypothetical protein